MEASLATSGFWQQGGIYTLELAGQAPRCSLPGSDTSFMKNNNVDGGLMNVRFLHWLGHKRDILV